MIKAALVGLVKTYRLLLSPWLGAACLRWHHRFIAGLAMGCLSLIAVTLAALGKWMEPDMNGFLLLSLIAIGLSVLASRWLQQQRRQHV